MGDYFLCYLWVIIYFFFNFQQNAVQAINGAAAARGSFPKTKTWQMNFDNANALRVCIVYKRKSIEIILLIQFSLFFFSPNRKQVFALYLDYQFIPHY